MMRKACNGIYSGENLNLPNNFANCHLTYKGKSIIIDYEHVLHCYSENLPETCVPVEIYPFGDDITVIYAEIDEKWKKVDIGKLITLLDNILKDEPHG